MAAKPKTLRQNLYAAVKDTLVPFLEKESFVPQSDSNRLFIPMHRRRLDGGFDLIEIQFDKNARPLFFVNFAIAPAVGLYFPDDKSVAAEDAHVYHTHRRGRLRVKSGGSVVHGATLWRRLCDRGDVVQKCVENCIHQYPHIAAWYADQSPSQYIDVVDFPVIGKTAD